MKTTLATNSDHTKSWYIVDAANETLGRVSVKIANVLEVATNRPILRMPIRGFRCGRQRREDQTYKKNTDKSYMFYSG